MHTPEDPFIPDPADPYSHAVPAILNLRATKTWAEARRVVRDQRAQLATLAGFMLVYMLRREEPKMSEEYKRLGLFLLLIWGTMHET
jgi:hypothetical protein